MKNLNKYKITAIYILLIITIITVVDSGVTAGFRSWLKVAIPHLDKFGHFFGMGMLAFLLNNLFHKSKTSKITLASFAGVMIACPLSTIEEFSQKMLTYRSFSYGDLAANYLGIIVFTLVFFWVLKKEKIRKI